jgi:putative nucleotidyltransferase with HDIG domain
MELFQRMQLCEQAHSLQVYKTLAQQQAQAAEEGWEDLLVAALLHDVGKNRLPLRLWERVEIVLARTLLPEKSRAWGAIPDGAVDGKSLGWRKPFVAAAHHAEWGAEMAAEVGASPLAASLIRRHQEAAGPGSTVLEERLLAQLQAADNNS